MGLNACGFLQRFGRDARPCLDNPTQFTRTDLVGQLSGMR
jgi:hypothetical protein